MRGSLYVKSKQRAHCAGHAAARARNTGEETDRASDAGQLHSPIKDCNNSQRPDIVFAYHMRFTGFIVPYQKKLSTGLEQWKLQ